MYFCSLTLISFDHIFKGIKIFFPCDGAGVGKTSLVTRYETNIFHKSTSSTIGASFSNVEILVDDYKVKMQVRQHRP